MAIALLNCGLLRPKHQRKAAQKVGYAIPWFDLPLKQTHRHVPCEVDGSVMLENKHRAGH